jgi:hypothetical protein
MSVAVADVQAPEQLVDGYTLLREADLVHSAYAVALEGSKTKYPAHLLPYQNYIAYYTNLANGLDAATLHQVGCRIRDSDAASNRATGGELERMAKEVAKLQANWTAFNGRYGEVALLYLQNRRRPERRVLESQYALGVLSRQYARQ